MTGTKNEIEQPDLNEINASYAQSHEQHHNMAGFRAPKIDTVRVGIIGMGKR